MLSNKLRMYYSIKRILPRFFQIAVRRRLVMYKLAELGGVWPTYDPVIPEGWGGWPEGKKFALVLTHDVDTALGYQRCFDVVDIEEKLGFRSSYNLVVRDYEVSPKVREELVRRGFEIGVHGLNHNGSLYHSKGEFFDQSVQINQVIREWDVVGFRSPCMYHNLEWIQDLEVEYDSSTFDVDPFEPQPDGMHTMFPFTVHEKNNGRAYVELPYTLPQDFTLFVLMRHRNIDAWKQKLDWVANHGGMALMLTHPDYMSFGPKPVPNEYPADYYKEMLEYVKSRYEGMYWHALPRDVARFWSGLPFAGSASRERSGPSRTKLIAPAQVIPDARGIGPNGVGAPLPLPLKAPRRVCMLAYSFYEFDNRIRRYAEALAKRGDHVDVIALSGNGFPDYEIINGVNIFRIQERKRHEKSKLSYLLPLLKFLVNSAAFITRRHLVSKYDLVHIHSVPDFEVFAALIPKLLGAKLILDIHDIVPEFYAAKFNAGRKSFFFKGLLFLEKASILFSDHVIISNHIWEKRLINRSSPPQKCSTLLNYPDTSAVCTPDQNENGRFVALYPGSFNWHQGLDIAIRAFAIVAKELPEAQFDLYGSGPEEESLRALVRELGLEGRVLFKGSLPLDAVWQVMSCASVGVVPKRNDSFGGEAFSTKVFEFMSLGVPVILSRTNIDRFYFDDSLVCFFEPENYKEMANLMVSLASDENRKQTLVKNSLKFIEDLRWERKKDDYFNLVDKLLCDDAKLCSRSM